MKAMASDVNQRYISADAMLADLEEFRKNPSINFDYTPADLLVTEGDEPTQVLGANTPSNVRTQPVHADRYEEEETWTRSRPVRREENPRPKNRNRRYDDEDDYDEVRGGGSRLPIYLAIAAVALFLVGMGVFLWISFFGGITGNSGEFNVPRLYGMTVEDAKQNADVIKGNFQIVVGGTTASDLPEGQIVSQDPESGRNAQSGAIITVTLSDGSGADDEETGKMPDLVNKDQRIAIATLKELGYSEEEGNLEIREEASEDVTKEYVISTDPVAHSDLEGVDKIILVVSSGPESDPVTVINFINMEAQQAKEAAEGMGLVVSSMEEVYDASVPAGYVCWQSIENKTQVEKGQTISFRVSKGPEPSTEPSTAPTPNQPDSSTQPTPGGQVNAISYTIQLPRDRETVQVTVQVAGQTQYDKTLDTAQQLVVVTLKGSGTQEVTVYFDGQLDHSVSKDFG